MEQIPQMNEQQVIEHLQSIGQGHLVEGITTFSQEVRDQFVKQVNTINQNYPGGVKEYTERARKLLKNSYEDVNPYEGFTPHIPQGETVDYENTEQLVKLENIGIQEVSKTCFVLVAGGLGERLGYDGIKIGIPIELVTRTTFLEYYIQYILAFQAKYCIKLSLKKSQAPNNPLPFAIMTSDDTHTQTLLMLEQNFYFGMEKSQLTLIKQEKIPAMIDNEARFAQVPGSLLIDTKPHGHGDIHTLLYMSGLAQKWATEGRQWLFIFQDTNPLSFRALPSVLGVSKVRGFELNSITVPRKTGEAVGAICELRGQNGSQITINVEYNQLGPLMKSIGGEPVDDKGYSRYPGNINSLLFSLQQYSNILQESKGLIAEFINPKYADNTKTKFKSPTRLECMMQDYPKLLKAENKVGFTQFAREFCFTTVKNDLLTAQQKCQQQLPPECAASCESDFYFINTKLLTMGIKIKILCFQQAHAKIISDDQKLTYEQTFQGVTVNLGPRVVLHPSFGVTFDEIRRRVENVQISNASTLVLKGEIQLQNIILDGILKLEGNGTYGKIFVNDQKYNHFVAVDPQTPHLPPYLKIRGYYLE